MVGRPSRTRTVLDWLRVTIPYEYDEKDSIKDYLSSNNNLQTCYRVSETSARDLVYAVINTLSLDGVNYTNASIATLNKLENALFGYDYTFVIGHARIMYKKARKYMTKSDAKMGVCLELSSHALRDIEQSSSFTNWITFFQNIKHFFPDARFTRIDIASDFFKDMKRLSAEGLHRLLKDKKINFVTTSRSDPRYLGKVSRSLKKDYGESVYIQAPSSAYMLRVYNKLEERINSHGDAWLKRNKIKNWTRWEIQYNSDFAPRVADEIVNGVDPAWIWQDTIRHLMSFQVPDTIVKTNQKSKYKKIDWQDPRTKKIKKVWVPDWWDAFLNEDHIPRFDYSGKTPQWTYDKHMQWLSKCMLSAFVKDLLVQIIQGGDVDVYMNHLLDQGMAKLKPKDIDDLVHYAKEIKASKFYQTDNKFEFTDTVKKIGDKFTGMVSARLYDHRNYPKLKQDDLAEIKLHEYETFVREHGIADNYYNLKGTGVIK